MLATYTASTDSFPRPASSSALSEAAASISSSVSSSRRPKGSMPTPRIATSLMMSSPLQAGDAFADRVVVGELDLGHGHVHQVLGHRAIPHHQARLGLKVDLARQAVGVAAPQLMRDLGRFERVLDHPAPEADPAFRHHQD